MSLNNYVLNNYPLPHKKIGVLAGKKERKKERKRKTLWEGNNLQCNYEA